MDYSFSSETFFFNIPKSNLLPNEPKNTENTEDAIKAAIKLQNRFPLVNPGSGKKYAPMMIPAIEASKAPLPESLYAYIP